MSILSMAAGMYFIFAADTDGGNADPYTSWQMLLIAGGVMFVSWTMFRMHARRMKAREEARRAGGESTVARLSSLKMESRARDTVESLISELTDACRDTGAHLESRIRILNELIAQADRRIEMLRALGAVPSARNVSGAGSSAHASDPDSTKASPPAASNSHRQDRFQEVLAWADKGLTPVDIAKKTGTSRGEVELILSLRGWRGNSTVPQANLESAEPNRKADTARNETGDSKRG